MKRIFVVLALASCAGASAFTTNQHAAKSSVGAQRPVVLSPYVINYRYLTVTGGNVGVRVSFGLVVALFLCRSYSYAFFILLFPFNEQNTFIYSILTQFFPLFSTFHISDITYIPFCLGTHTDKSSMSNPPLHWHSRRLEVPRRKKNLQNHPVAWRKHFKSVDTLPCGICSTLPTTFTTSKP